jgi:hypothetical protein
MSTIICTCPHCSDSTFRPSRGRSRWVVSIGYDHFWHKYKHAPMGHWTTSYDRATKFCRQRALVYLRDWKSYGAVLIRMPDATG